MDYSLGFQRNINFPILTVTGGAGSSGADGTDGIVVLFDNTPITPVPTITTSWETFTGMTSGAITDLAVAGDKLLVTGIVTVDDDDSDINKRKRSLRIYVDESVALGAGVSFYYDVPSGITRVKFVVELTVESATLLYIDAMVYSTSNVTADTIVSYFGEVISVTDVTSLSNIAMQGNSFSAGDMQCENFSVKLMKKTT